MSNTPPRHPHEWCRSILISGIYYYPLLQLQQVSHHHQVSTAQHLAHPAPLNSSSAAAGLPIDCSLCKRRSAISILQINVNTLIAQQELHNMSMTHLCDGGKSCVAVIVLGFDVKGDSANIWLGG
ncbi:hypothetical protein N7520_002383 [Penicillium odoratum]|uniref:uncharacterized protein n=1 Tax=Penicillium odoratum TaxID=1167516 RepID=UPI0025494E9E|nr:uncharacterized protein N7520_002383 [Penicillium odoratum]KAJ5771854.1 hypothetical protein N7520_002383 [Penicillium odoratum]